MKPPSSSSKKILILHATAGAGHRKAAEAVFNGLKSRGISADIVDALTYTSPFFRKTYSQGYEFMVGKLPKLWAVFVTLTDQKWFQPVLRPVRRLYNRLNAAPLARFIRDGQYDVIVTTHFLSTEVCGWLRRTGQINARFVTIVTDFDVHRIWQVKGVDVYLVDEKFIQPRLKAETRRKLGLREDRFTVLLSTSSFGFGPIEELATLLKDLQLIIICGNNKTLFEKMTDRGNPLHKICGFVDNMEEMMAASDVMLTKPGGLSVSEALANNLPLIFFSAIPGQEAGNVRVLAEHGIGLSDKTLPEMAAALKTFAASPETYQAARDATKALARPYSVADIIKHLI
jgi:processive 1,2-diacylglycerol beta-glucosyltransferase